MIFFSLPYPRETIDSYINCLKSAGLKPRALEIESFAISRALIKNEIATSPVLLIDLGATRTSFIVFSGDCVRFTSSIPISSMGFTEIISKNLGATISEAEELKIKYGLGGRIRFKIGNGSEKKIEKGKIFEALIPALVDLTQQIRSHIDYYQTHASHEHLLSGGEVVPKIILCGGGANLKGLSELLSIELKIPIELGNPWVNILSGGKKEVVKLPLEKALGYTTAIGLALRGIKEK